ncbi:MAG: hypothetical protein RL748_3891, partial [Pseudomonadota bacterium]
MTTMYAMQCAPTSMFQILATSLNDAKGCAFLLAKDKLVTCSHVIDTALGSKNVQVGALVNCRWVNDKTEGSCRCKVIKYYPQKYETEPSCADICILQIESWEGQAALTAHPTSTDYQVGADLGMYCENPQSKGYGRHLSGRGNGSVQAGRVQIDLLQNGRESHAGFSGCPVFDLTAGKCVGMFVAQLSDGRSTSYMIAMASINTVWRELGQETGQDNGKPIVPWWQAQIARQLSFDVAARFAAALIEKSEQTDLDSTLAWFQAQLHSQEVTPLWKLNMVLESVICGDLDAGPCNKIKDWTLLIAGAFAAATIAPQGQASGTCVHQVPSEKKLLAQTYGAGLAKVPANWATPPEFDLECGARPDE